MKRVRLQLFLTALLVVVAALAQAQDKVMLVHSGGSVAYAVNASQVDSVTFRDGVIPTSLTSTTWLLIGFGDTQTGSVKKVEPNGNRCYIFTFNDDNTLTGYSSTNDLMGTYTADFDKSTIEMIVGGTERGEVGDGYLYIDALVSVESFSLSPAGELKLYYNDKKSYLLYKGVGRADAIIAENSVWKYENHFFDSTIEITFRPSEKKLQIKSSFEKVEYPYLIGGNSVESYYIEDNRLYLKDSEGEFNDWDFWVVTFLSENEMLLEYGGNTFAIPYIIGYLFTRQSD